MDVKVLTPVDLFAPESWRSAGSGSIVGRVGGLGTNAFHGRQKRRRKPQRMKHQPLGCESDKKMPAPHKTRISWSPALVCSRADQVTTACLALLLMHQESILGSVPVSYDL
jgi:hypothetical protein